MELHLEGSAPAAYASGLFIQVDYTKQHQIAWVKDIEQPYFVKVKDP